jgi:hypothetical protein
MARVRLGPRILTRSPFRRVINSHTRAACLRSARLSSSQTRSYASYTPLLSIVFLYASCTTRVLLSWCSPPLPLDPAARSVVPPVPSCTTTLLTRRSSPLSSDPLYASCTTRVLLSWCSPPLPLDSAARSAGPYAPCTTPLLSPLSSDFKYHAPIRFLHHESSSPLLPLDSAARSVVPPVPSCYSCGVP